MSNASDPLIKKSVQADPIGSSRCVVRAILAVETSEGVGAVVRRSIGNQSLRNFNPFLMLDHFQAGKGGGFPDHPHRGQATVTYMLTGKIQHEDFTGHAGVIGPGDLQWMIAGKGIVHSEMPLFENEHSQNPSGLQLWIDLPKQFKLTEPDYQELKHDQIPSIELDGGVKIKVISGISHGIQSPVRHLGGCWYFDIQLSQPDSRVFQIIPKGWNAFAYGLNGKIRFGNPDHQEGNGAKTIDPFHTVILSSDPHQDGIEISNGDPTQVNARLLLIAGEPLDQPIVQYGPFVMNSQEEVIQAFHDYRSGTNGFEKAGHWVSSIGHRP